MGKLKDSARVLILLSAAVVLLSVKSFLVTPSGYETPSYLKENATEGIENERENVGIGVTTDNPESTKVGMDVLKRGGNAVDAAIAISYSLAVTEPSASGIGGGGLMLIHPPEGSSKEPVVYDYRETAPSEESMPDSKVGIPGFVKGMDEVHKDYGTESMENLMKPAISQAKNGVNVSNNLHLRLSDAGYKVQGDNIEKFFPNGKTIKEGAKLKQQELAETMTEISKKGPEAFYQGEIAENLEEKTEISKDDLREYEVNKTEPIKGNFKDFNVLAPPPPAGGVMLVQSLQVAEHLNLENKTENQADFIESAGEINDKTYANRYDNIGDPAFVDVPTNKLISEEYTKELAGDVSSDELDEENVTKGEKDKDGNTTHFVVVDQNGMMVSVTNTISDYFGSGLYTNGFFLNNQLDNFTRSDDSPNEYEPGKRPYSYISPTILTKDEKPVIGIGMAGGRRITPVLTQVLSRHLLFDMPIQQAIDENRIHKNLDEKEIYLEERFPEKTKKELEERGYSLNERQTPEYFGSVQSLIVDYKEDKVYGGAEPRRNGEWSIR
ncbi:gamma-glutamyltransferase [Alteribacillus sp. JSM 102045]|uniref:gamma-glutamyltransferase n=1 Tax=Alteribacillus sp. JSM 102045 TaxID=1562101 RepID=UPI0035C188BF